MLTHLRIIVMLCGATGSALLAEHVLLMFLTVAVTVAVMIGIYEIESRRT